MDERWIVRATLNRLREDAVARGMLPLAIAYGFACIRLGNEVIQDQTKSVQHPQPS